MTSQRTIAERGTEVVNRYVNGDIKAAFTFFASVVADGTKLPLVLVAKGRTTCCHKQFGKHEQVSHEIWHSHNGWCTEGLMLRYLGWLRTQIASEVCVLLDQFGAQGTPSVHDEPSRLNIHFVFVPERGTGRYQPFDRRSFGALKFKGRAKRVRYYQENPGIVCTCEIAADLSLISWIELDQSCILAAWDLEEEPEQDSSSSDDDEEWSLTLASESDDSDEENEEENGDDSSEEDDDHEDPGEVAEVVTHLEGRSGFSVPKCTRLHQHVWNQDKSLISYVVIDDRWCPKSASFEIL
jgi:hypothetical protein